MLQFVNRVVTDLQTRKAMAAEEGQGLVEYALIIVLVSIVAAVALTTLGGTVTGVFNDIVAELGGGGS